MPAGVSVRFDHDSGRLVVDKHFDDEAGAEALRSLLALVARPGVVQLVDDGGPPGVVTTAYVGSHTLATWQPASAEDAFEFARELVRLVAGLHRDGFAHGALRPEHVLVDAAGRPVLCGFAARGPSASQGLGRPGSETSVETEGEYQEDVVALGRLVALLAEKARTTLGRRLDPQSPGRSRRRDRRVGMELVTRLARLAESADEPDATAQSLAASLDEPFDPPSHTARLSLIGIRRPWKGVFRRFATSGSVALLPIGAAMVVVAVARIASGATDATWREPTREEPRPTDRPRRDSTRPDPVETDRRQEVAACPPATDPPQYLFDLDGDGCSEPAVIHEGMVGTSDGWIAVGDPDDVVVLGDWDCDGSSTPALLRRGTGEVFVFDRWPPRDGSLSATPVTEVSDATDLDVRRDGRCDVLYVETADASVRVSTGTQAGTRPRAEFREEGSDRP
ncbi:MAG: hypothetical protein KatS3mg008_1971 [Acidimicrobiales bacterium]|nr:MAG: hypothetical protein KatS3mg008_1971 [Acidimicrobiales bacterium]